MLGGGGGGAVISLELQFIRAVLLMKQRKMRRDSRSSYTILILAEILSDTIVWGIAETQHSPGEEL